jgi:hypothetical protein
MEKLNKVGVSEMKKTFHFLIFFFSFQLSMERKVLFMKANPKKEQQRKLQLPLMMMILLI